jgi:hypothetical protein
LVGPLIDTVFFFLAHPRTPWVLSLLIAVAAMALWLRFSLAVGRVAAGLDRAIAAVENADGHSSFRSRFPSVFAKLAENPVVGELWRAYAPTLTSAPGAEDAIGYSRRPGAHFNLEMLATAGVNLRFFHAVPNLLVGAGLLFTFIGLVGALYFASRGVAAAELRVAQAALKDLLAAATFKFATSIAGLGSSLLFSWGEKSRLFGLQRRIDRLCAALEARMVPVTVESLGTAQLAELKAQSAEMRHLSRSLLVRLPEAVEQEVTRELQAALEPLHAAAKRLAARLPRLDEVLVGAMAQHLTEHLERWGGASATEEAGLPRLVAALEALNARLAAMGDGWVAGEGPRQAVRSGSQAAGIACLDGSIGRAALALGQALKRVGAGRAGAVEAARRSALRAACDHLQEAREELARLRTAPGEGTEASEPLERVAAELQQALGAIRSLMKGEVEERPT